MEKVYVIDGPLKGSTFNFKVTITTIGRSSDNDICIADNTVSRHHAKFLKKNDRVVIVDLNSLQGVFIDGEKVKPGEEVEIAKESKVLIGKTMLAFQDVYGKKIRRFGYTRETAKQPDLDESSLVREDTRNHAGGLELLLKVSNTFVQSPNLEELFAVTIDQIFDLFKRIDRGAILLLDKETGTVREMVSKTKTEEKIGLMSKINYSRTMVRRALETVNPVMMSDTLRVNKADLSDTMEQMNVRSVMCVPLVFKGEAIGVVYVDSIGLPDGFRKDDLHLLTSLSNIAAIAIQNAQLYEAVKQQLDEHKKTEKELKAKTDSLAELNAALKVLLKRRDEDKTELEEKVLFNLRELVFPCLEKLKKSGLNEKQMAYANVLESNLDDIISPFTQRLSSWHRRLTPTEIQVANLIKHGKTTKEIAEILNLSNQTIDFHRKNIREKIGIKNERTNLRTHLLSIQ